MKNRLHAVKLTNTISEYEVLNHGMPEGTVLGLIVLSLSLSLSLSLYVNDFHSVLNDQNRAIHFADDTSYCKNTRK